MRLLEKYMRAMAVLTVWVVISSLAGHTEVSAAEDESGRRGSITIELQDLGTEKSEVGFRVYQVSEIDGGTDLAGADWTSAKEMSRLAEQLEKKAGKAGIHCVEKDTDEEGRVTFSDLPMDFYLVSQSDTAEYGMVDPFLVAIPSAGEGEEEIYEVVAWPKGERLEEETETETRETKDSETPPSHKTPETSSGKKTGQVKTGDGSALGLYALLAAAAALTVYIAGRRNRMRDR